MERRDDATNRALSSDSARLALDKIIRELRVNTDGISANDWALIYDDVLEEVQFQRARKCGARKS